MAEQGFMREKRYLIFKLADVQKYLHSEEISALRGLGDTIEKGRKEDGRPPLVDALVIERDWPEYEVAWAGIEARMAGGDPKWLTGLTLLATSANSTQEIFLHPDQVKYLLYRHRHQTERVEDVARGFATASARVQELERSFDALQSSYDLLLNIVDNALNQGDNGVGVKGIVDELKSILPFEKQKFADLVLRASSCADRMSDAIQNGELDRDMALCFLEELRQMVKCSAVQMSDQMYCDRCGTTWDVNDPYPPACKQELVAS